MKDKIVIQQVAEEQYQGHSTRRHLYVELEKMMGKPIISFFTSFRYPVMIEDSDADMIEGIFQKSDLSNGFALVLNSPGGDGLAAERIINICRSYSGTNKYDVIIPSKAKSAATMISLGASKIIMSETSELGSVDPQVTYVEDNRIKRFSVYNLVKSYEDLFARAVKEKGNLQPYLQQLSNYDEREIAEFKTALALSEDIAIKALKTGMLSDLSEKEIKKKIKIFLTPEKVKTHGRPIYARDALKCGLNIEIKDLKSKFWQLIYELYVRLNNFVSTNNIAKCIESKEYSFKAKMEVKK
ncbi:MAG: hypothetical protein J7K47_05660 [Thermoplasmata archaeon]|nr:hypothetical protein [Thermoplasmata archaeon]